MRATVGFGFILMIPFTLTKCEEHVIIKKYATVTDITTEPETTPKETTTETEGAIFSTTVSESLNLEREISTQNNKEKNIGKLFIIDLSDVGKIGDKIYKESEKAGTFVSSIFETLQQASGQILESFKNGDVSEIFKVTPDTSPTSITRPKIYKRDAKCSSSGPQCTGEGYFRLNQSCIKFYRCNFDPKCNKLISKIYTCPKCLKFNAEKKICDLPRNVPECSYMSTSPKHFCTGPGKFFVPDDCYKYYDCVKSTNSTTFKLTVETCPQDSIFSQKHQICVKKKRCNRHMPTCGPGKFYLEDKFDCSNFYYCITQNNTALLACPPNSVFDGQGCEIFEKSKLNWEKIKKRFQKYKN